MFHKEVRTQEELDVFFQITKEAWNENEWFYEDISEDDVKKYIIARSKDSDYIGAVEIYPYRNDRDKSSSKDIFSFKNIKGLGSNVYELDKLCLQKEARNQSLECLLEALVVIALENRIEQYVSVTRPSLYRLLHRTFKLPITKVGDAVYYEKDKQSYVPIIINMNQVLHNIDLQVVFTDDVRTRLKQLTQKYLMKV